LSYREENGQVVLTMSLEDYAELFDQLDIVLEWLRDSDAPFHVRVAGRKVETISDRLNSGNHNYTPYQVEEKRPKP
jgi:hypothetical protein